MSDEDVKKYDLDLMSIEGNPSKPTLSIGNVSPEPTLAFNSPAATLLSGTLPTPKAIAGIADIAAGTIKASEAILGFSKTLENSSLAINTALKNVGSLSTAAIALHNSQVFTIADTVKKFHDTLTFPALKIKKTLDSVAYTPALAKLMASRIDASLPKIKDTLLDLRALNSVAQIGSDTTVDFSLISATPVKDNETTLKSIGQIRSIHGSIQLTHSVALTISARLEKVEGKQETILAQLKKLDTIEQLIRNGTMRLLPARIRSYKLDERNATLTINGKDVVLEPSSRQEQLCKLFLSDKADNLTKRLHIDQIIEEYGETITSDRIKAWNASFYQAARHLNAKIGIVLGSSTRLFITQGQYFWLNEDCLEVFG